MTAGDDDDGLELIGPGGKIDAEALLRLYERRAGGDAASERSSDVELDAQGGGGADGDGDDAPISVTLRLRRDLDKRLDRYLVDRIPFLSRTSLQRLIDEGGVTVNGRMPKASTRLRARDEVVIVLPPPPSDAIPAEDIPLDVLFEDDDIIVLNKQDDIIVHPARGNKSGTIINALAWHFLHRTSGALSEVGREHARPGVVHRLDRHTTGVMIAAKSDVAHWRLGRQFEQRRTDKRYLAVVHGRMEVLADVVDLPLGKHPTIRERYAVRWDESGKASVTIFRVRELYDGFTLVELELKTGRTHQIRVHLSHLGHPIVGDDMYGGRHLAVGDVAGTNEPTPLIVRQALHATTLGLRHPMSGEPVTFCAAVHPDMRRLIALLRAHRTPEPVTVPGATIDLDATIPPP